MRFARLSLFAGLTLAVFAGATRMMADTPDGPVSELIFSHSLHAIENDIECIVCHEGIPSSTTADSRHLPSMDICGDCHDTEDDATCGQCHRDPDDPMPATGSTLALRFNHQRHLELTTGCPTCHNLAEGAGERAPMPGKALCMSCHDGLRADRDCQLCHTDRTALADIHPIGWRHGHAEPATANPDWCRTCHQQEDYCVACHRGDNPTGNIHDLNYEFTHGLDAQGKEADCARCHDRRTFCNDCHGRENRMPLAHSTRGWRFDHGPAARKDIENCASCHETDDPTCARPGCHSDSDGMRGTDLRIHSSGSGRFDSHGPWHSDNGYFCFDCHTNTARPGAGFCGYCHGDKD